MSCHDGFISCKRPGMKLGKKTKTILTGVIEGPGDGDCPNGFRVCLPTLHMFYPKL